MKIKLAQYGISHDHASGKARVMQENNDVDFCGTFELTLVLCQVSYDKSLPARLG